MAQKFNAYEIFVLHNEKGRRRRRKGASGEREM
jgi:hypothetical protein